jgi:hypothetical protein
MWESFLEDVDDSRRSILQSRLVLEMVCLPRLLRVNWSIMQDQTLLLDTGRLVRLALVTAQNICPVPVQLSPVGGSGPNQSSAVGEIVVCRLWRDKCTLIPVI